MLQNRSTSTPPQNHTLPAWWYLLRQDVAIPFMMDGRFPPDVFFLICEADFRYYESDCLERAEWETIKSGGLSSSSDPQGGAGRPPDRAAADEGPEDDVPPPRILPKGRREREILRT